MIVTKSWLSEWIDIKYVSTDELTTTLNRIGLEVDRVEEFLPPKGIVVGKVLSNEPHPDAERLQICQVDIGSETVQIVTNDKKVGADMYVPVATVGTELKDFKIKKSKLRGVESLGMFCSTEEFGMPRVGEGVVILDNSIGELKLGKELSEFPLFSDTLIEIELTANRGDCLSIYGVARELSTALNTPLHKFEVEPTISPEEVDGDYPDFSISYSKIELTNDKELPLKVATRTALLEKSLKGNLDNILLYSTHSTGVLHKEITTTINNPILKVDNGFLKLFSNDTEISNIGVNKFSRSYGESYIESSYIDPETVSRAVASSKTDTDALYYNSSRGSEPDIALGKEFLKRTLQDSGLLKSCDDALSLHRVSENRTVEIDFQAINSFIGMEIEGSKVIRILEHLDFKVENGEKLLVEIPRFRHDIYNQQDIIEEILRIIGIDNIPAKPLSFGEENRRNSTSDQFDMINSIREKSVANGFFESVHYIFNDSKTVEKYGFKTFGGDKALLNPIVETMDILRPTLMFGLLEAVGRNRRNGREKIDLFEIGSIFSSEREESREIAFVSSGVSEEESINNGGKGQQLNFVDFAQKVINSIGGGEIIESTPETSLQHPYQIADIVVRGEKIGKIYKLHLKVQNEMDLGDTLCAEISVDKLSNPLKTASDYSKYQASTRDLSVVVGKEQSYRPIKKAISELKNPLIVDFYPLDIYNLEDGNSLTLRFKLQSMEDTLQEADITAVTDEVLQLLKDEFKAELR